MDTPKEWPAGSQINTGPGLLVGRDLKIEQLDPKTKAVLHKLAKDAPALGAIVHRALTEGVISPDAVYTLATAARNINEDVANILSRASACINEDVAHLLSRAADSINPNVADSLFTVSHEIQNRTKDLEGVLYQLQQASESASLTIAKTEELKRVCEEMNSASHMLLSASQSRGVNAFSWDSFRKGVAASLFAMAVIAGAAVVASYLLR